MAVEQSRLVREKRRFFDFNCLPWQRPLRNQKRGPDRSSMNKCLSFGAKTVKIVLADLEISCIRLSGASIPMGQGGHVPHIYKGVTSMIMSPNVLEVMSFKLGLFYPVTATTVVCCNANIMLFHKKLQLLGRPLTGAPPESFLCPPNNPVRSTPLPSDH